MFYNSGDRFSLKYTFTLATLTKILTDKNPWHIPRNKALKKNTIITYCFFYEGVSAHPHCFNFRKEYTRWGGKRYTTDRFCLSDEEVNILLKYLGPTSKQLEFDFGRE